MKGYLPIFVAAALWGLIGALSRGVLGAGVGALELAFWRAALAGGMFALHAGLTRQRVPRGRDVGIFALFSLVAVALFYSAYTLAVQAGGVSLASILLYSAPAFVALAAWPLFGETPTLRQLGLLGVTLSGVVLVSRSGGAGVTVSGAALFWGLTAALSYSSYYLFGKWSLSRYTPVTIYAWVLPFGALGLLPFVTFSPKSPTVWLLLGLLALVSTYAAYGLYYTGLKHVPASRAVLVASIEPVVAAVSGALLFGERLGVWGVVGGVLVLAAAVGASLPSRAAKTPEPAAERVRARNG